MSHIRRVNKILAEGYAHNISGYWDAPVSHLIWSINSLVLNLDILTTRHIMIIIPAIGILGIFILTRSLFDSETIALISSNIYAFFTLTNRVKLLIEAVAIVYIIFILYVIVKRSSRSFKSENTSYSILFVILFALLLHTHHYYPLLITLWVALTTVTLMTFSKRIALLTRKTFIFYSMSALVVWTAKISLTDRLVSKLAISISQLSNSIVTTGIFASTSIQPEALSAEITPTQFVLIHFIEFTIISIAIFSILLIIENCRSIRNKKLWFILSFIMFSIYSFFALLIEGQRNLPTTVSLRNVYLIAVLLIPIAGYGIGKSMNNILSFGHFSGTECYSWDNGSKFAKKFLTVVIILTLISAIIFTSISSIQANKLDPVIHQGNTQSPRVITDEKVVTTGNFLRYASTNSLIIGDDVSLHPYSTTDPATISSVHHRIPESGITNNYTTQTFSNPTLPELKSDYEYLLLSKYPIKKGMIFNAKVPGLRYDDRSLTQEIGHSNRIWDSGEVAIRSNNP